MNIWAAAGSIVGVALAAFASVFAKMVYKEVRDARKRPMQLPLPPMPKVTKEEEEQSLHPTLV